MGGGISVVMVCLKLLAFMNCIRYQTLHLNMQCDLFSYGVFSSNINFEGYLFGESRDIFRS